MKLGKLGKLIPKDRFVSGENISLKAMTGLILISLVHLLTHNMNTGCFTFLFSFNYCTACNNMGSFEATSGSNRQTFVNAFLFLFLIFWTRLNISNISFEIFLFFSPTRKHIYCTTQKKLRVKGFFFFIFVSMSSLV